MKLLNPFKSAIAFGIFFFVTALLVIWGLDRAGYQLDNFTYVRGGSITLEGLEAASLIFLNNEEKTLTRADQPTYQFDRVQPGIRPVLVAKDGYWPWLKDVHVVKGDNNTFTPFYVLKNAPGKLLEIENEQYATSVAKLNQRSLPSLNAKRFSADGSVAIWVDGSTIFGEWTATSTPLPTRFCPDEECHQDDTFTIVSLEAPVRSLEFYKGRSDVIAFATQNAIYAIELDQRSIQNFQPIYKGNQPLFAEIERDILVIKDEDFIFTLNI